MHIATTADRLKRAHLEMTDQELSELLERAMRFERAHRAGDYRDVSVAMATALNPDAADGLRARPVSKRAARNLCKHRRRTYEERRDGHNS